MVLSHEEPHGIEGIILLKGAIIHWLAVAMVSGVGSPSNTPSGLEPLEKIHHKTSWKKSTMLDIFAPQKWSRYVTLEFKENERMPCDLLLHRQLRSLLNVDEPYFSTEKNKVTIRVTTEAQSKLLLETNSLCMKVVEPKVEARYNTRVGTMLLDRLRVEDESNEVLCDCIKDILTSQKHNVLDVKIYERQSTRTKKNLRIAKVTFGQQTIPRHMKVGVKRISIQEEFPKPMQCRICLRFEHTHKRCPNREDVNSKRCFRCGKEGHDANICTDVECYNCGGLHHAFSRECFHYKYYQEALVRSREHGISIRDAKRDMKEDGITLTRSLYTTRLKQNNISSPSKRKSQVSASTTNQSSPKKSTPLQNENEISTQNRYSILEDREIYEDATQYISPPKTPPAQSVLSHPKSRESSPSKTSHYSEKPNKMNHSNNLEISTTPDFEAMEKQLMELDGVTEYSKRTRGDSPSNESNEPVKKS